ncbi:hypothetical protein [Zhongshania sp.]|uniref:hypothetical protein n=1 Tax=Zhongshania sp. TaxID=1971902 RepID=UPI00356675DD
MPSKTGTPHHSRRLIAADPLRAARPARALRNSPAGSDSPHAIPAPAAPCSAVLRGI